jgi:hypothetical protein
VKRIVKTGVLAAAATAGFALFAYRVADWSRGMDSEIVVLGQAGEPGTCPADATGTAAVRTIKIIPQIAVDSFDGGLAKYSTFIQIINTGETSQSIAGAFYKQDGTPLDNVTLTAGQATITNGVVEPASIPKNGTLVISGGGTTKAGVLGWGRLALCGALIVSTFFELRDGRSNVLYSRVAVAASPANMSSFVIPRIRDVAAGLDVGLALVNTALDGSATLTAELKDAAGNTLATKDIPMQGRSQKSLFTREIFPSLVEDRGRNYQYLKFSSASSVFAASALSYEGPTLTSFPVEALQ